MSRSTHSETRDCHGVQQVEAGRKWVLDFAHDVVAPGRRSGRSSCVPSSPDG